MSNNVFTLDAMREEIEKKFAPVKIGLRDGSEVTLRNLVRLPKKDRVEVLGLLEGLEEDGKGDDVSLDEVQDILDVVGKILPIVAESPARGRKLVSEIGDDYALTTKVLETWMGASQPPDR
jgi:hypothetical protein